MITVDSQNIGVGFAGGYPCLVFTLVPHRRHVTLGTYGGASLPDPAALMDGSGKVHRHIKIHDEAEFARPELRDLLEAAMTHRTA